MLRAVRTRPFASVSLSAAPRWRDNASVSTDSNAAALVTVGARDTYNTACKKACEIIFVCRGLLRRLCSGTLVEN